MSRYWVGGTGTWDNSTTTHWASSSGGAGGESVPGSSDDVIFDGSSGGGTITVDLGGTKTISSLTMGAFTGTWNNSVNNNNFVFTGSLFAFSISGTGTRTINLGSATYTLSNTTTAFFSSSVVTNLTLSAGSSTIAFTGGAASKVFNGGAQTYGTLSLAACSGAGVYQFTSGFTAANITLTAPCFLRFANSTSFTVTNPIAWVGSSASPIYVAADVMGTDATLALAAGSTFEWAGIRDITATGSPVATNSFDLGDNSGITFTRTGGGFLVTLI